MIKTLLPCSSPAALSRRPRPPCRHLRRPVATAESEIVGLVEAMPADKINFAPTKANSRASARLREQAKHLRRVLYMVAAAANEEKSPVGYRRGRKRAGVGEVARTRSSNS